MTAKWTVDQLSTPTCRAYAIGILVYVVAIYAVGNYFKYVICFELMAIDVENHISANH